MCKRRRIWLLSLAALCAVALAVYFEPSHCVRGWLWGEAFFDGRPTSYWRAELQCYDTWIAQAWPLIDPPPPALLVRVYSREPGRLVLLRESWTGNKGTRHVSAPPLLNDDPLAIPVLQELLADPSPKIRLFAQVGLGKDPEIPNIEE
jgi:hypothetical protein